MLLFLAGTSDARELALTLQKSGMDILTTVVTENAAEELKRVRLNVRVGRLTAEEMIELIETKQVKAIVDASHPFAEEASVNAMKAASRASVPYVRYERQSQQYQHPKMILVDDYEEAADIVAEKQGVVMLTTGSKTLQTFTRKLLHLDNIRLIARMLPRKDNMEKCETLGFPQKNIVAIQGPFTKPFNKALYEQFGVTHMITKESGKQGSVDEKVDAALELGIETIMIRRPRIQYDTVFSTYDEVVEHLNSLVVT
ncbi:precorrin-6A reductase [Pseudalkalibacillus decolorationis]|uniref:precorrin-6A reductase n=1 Tax=Pseudalkalibacillus decolorationis TaxID=163879 RepID=UPI0021474176|nr:precorrin-6A reductase [Pseudalkalibacillus decolorationis]